MSDDVTPGRIGNWTHTSLGGKFFPADPRPEEVFIEDIRMFHMLQIWIERENEL